MGLPDDEPGIRKFLASRNTTADEVICSTAATLDVATYLRSGGLSDEDLGVLLGRLLAGTSGDSQLRSDLG